MRTNTGALDKALADRERQMRQYRAAKRKQYAELYADVEYGVRFKRFVATLNHFGIRDSVKMVNYVTDECSKWIWEAPTRFAHAAIEVIDARVMKIRERAGLLAISDPMPGAPDDVFRVCKKKVEREREQ